MLLRTQNTQSAYALLKVQKALKELNTLKQHMLYSTLLKVQKALKALKQHMHEQMFTVLMYIYTYNMSYVYYLN